MRTPPVHLRLTSTFGACCGRPFLDRSTTPLRRTRHDGPIVEDRKKVTCKKCRAHPAFSNPKLRYQRTLGPGEWV